MSSFAQIPFPIIALLHKIFLHMLIGASPLVRSLSGGSVCIGTSLQFVLPFLPGRILILIHRLLSWRRAILDFLLLLYVYYP